MSVIATFTFPAGDRWTWEMIVAADFVGVADVWALGFALVARVALGIVMTVPPRAGTVITRAARARYHRRP